VFTDYPFFWPAMRNTLWLVVVMVTLRVIFGLGVGLLITKVKLGAGLFRTAFYLPYLAPPVAATLAFVFLLNPGTGPVNHVLGSIGLPELGWFNDPTWSKPALTLLALWGVGDLMVIFMASLLDVPKDQYEAAELDHAGPWQRFRFVTLPNISPIVLFAVVTGVIQTMQYYTQPLVAAKVASGVIGRPGQSFEPGYPEKSTLTLPHLVYNLGFQRFDTGSACVVALVLFALAMAFTAVLMRRGSGFLSAEDR
jgi:multiple sugar transport system permease protein